MRIDLDPRQARLQSLKRLVDPARDLKGVTPGELLHHQQQPGVAVDDRITDHRLMILLDIGDLAQRKAGAALILERHPGKVRGRDDWQNMPDTQPLVRRVDPTPGSDVGARGIFQQAHVERVGRGLHHVIEGHVVRGEPLGIDLHLQHFQALAPDRDIGHPGTRSNRSSIFQ